MQLIKAKVNYPNEVIWIGMLQGRRKAEEEEDSLPGHGGGGNQQRSPPSGSAVCLLLFFYFFFLFLFLLLLLFLLWFFFFFPLLFLLLLSPFHSLSPRLSLFFYFSPNLKQARVLIRNKTRINSGLGEFESTRNSLIFHFMITSNWNKADSNRSI